MALCVMAATGIPQAILFDVDGTLVDSNDLHAAAWQEALRRFGFHHDLAAVRFQVGKGGDNLLPALIGEDEAEARGDEIQDWRSDLFARSYLPRVTPFPGIRPLFERLYADDVRLVLATSAPAAELHFHLGLIGCEGLVFAATSKDDVDRSKPCPDIFETALARAGVDADRALVVGDSPWDVRAAKRAGLDCVALRCGGFDEADLLAEGPLALRDDAEDLRGTWPEWARAA